MAVPWAEKFGRFTRLFERLAIDIMKVCSVKAACEILRISWEEADGIKQRAVALGCSARRPGRRSAWGVDEKCASRGQDYVTIVARLDPGQPATVDYVGDGRKQATSDDYWEPMLSVAEAESRFAFARTTLHSPEDRVVTLAVGSDNTVEVWINGQQQLASSNPRSLRPDQDRFDVPFKKGSNEILL